MRWVDVALLAACFTFFSGVRVARADEKEACMEAHERGAA